jgi:hypothetical protein
MSSPERPLIGLVMMMRDEERMLAGSLVPARELADTWTLIDTGSTDDSITLALDLLDGLPGELYQRPWRNFGDNYTEALALARGSARWLLLLDADQMPEFHPGLRGWLATDPDPELDAFMVETEEGGTRWRLPVLLNGDREWQMIGATHEYLRLDGRRTRPLIGLTLHNLRPGGGDDPIARFEQNLELLAPGVEAGEARAIFYSAECLRFLGRENEAIDLYRERAAMPEFEEESWYAAYRAAELAGSREGLIAAWRRRPWRPEPLKALMRLVASQPNDDVLFKEPI